MAAHWPLAVPPGPPPRGDAEGIPVAMGARVCVHGSGHILGDATRTGRCLRAWVSWPSSALALWTGRVALGGAGSTPGAVCHQGWRSRALLLPGVAGVRAAGSPPWVWFRSAAPAAVPEGRSAAGALATLLLLASTVRAEMGRAMQTAWTGHGGGPSSCVAALGRAATFAVLTLGSWSLPTLGAWPQQLLGGEPG